MKISVIHIYWFLLLISVISSCLLFILVASEGIKSPSSEIINAQNDSEQINNFEGGKTDQLISQTEEAELKSSFEEIAQEIEHPDENKEFIVAQNAGVSDTGQAVVFTLVDTASAELHQRADSLPNAHVSHVTTHVLPPDTNNTQLHVNAGSGYTPTMLAQPGGGVVNIEQLEIQEQDQDTIVDGANRSLVDVAENVTDSNLSSPTPPSETGRIIQVESKTMSQEKDDIHSSPSNVTQQKLEAPQDTQEPNLPIESAEAEKEVQEDIPSFSEWTQKQLQEAEKKREKVNNSAQNNQPNKNSSNLKLRSKNYASPDCGAKIVAANPEAISAGSVLSHSTDEYKLNACTSRIWFIVELCEAIQAKKIDLANFELFSSSPKDFTISVSDRFPSRDWSSVGQFQAKDERDIQSFNLHPHLFGKFIKFEMLSHWGSEHFCPISLFRVYGTSEFEVLEKEDLQESEDDDEDETLDSYTGEPSKNLFGSARDAVMSIVKKAAEVLVKSGDSSNQTILNQSAKFSPLINTCSTPSHIVVCDNCSDVLFGEVYELLSCKSSYLQKLINLPLVNKSLYNTDICVEYGLNFFSKTTDKQTHIQCSCISSFFAPKYIAALCNVLAVLENKVVLNISSQYSNDSSIGDNETLYVDSFEIKSKVVEDIQVDACVYDGLKEVKTCGLDSTMETKPTMIVEDNFVNPTLELQIKPTKTLPTKDQIVDSSYQQQVDEMLMASTGQDSNVNPSEVPTQLSSVDHSTEPRNVSEDAINGEVVHLETENTEAFEIGHDQLDKLLSELNLEADAATTVAPPSNAPQQVQKESVFLRLSNRIKTLERNMSLSGQYLEELSRRYKKQVEEMQRAFEKKLTLITDENKRRDDELQQLHQKIDRLTSNIESLLTERDSLWKTASLLGQFLLIEIIITCILLYFCWRTPEGDTTNQKNGNKKLVDGQIKRRKSIDTIGHESPAVKRKRRPSEEALKISGTYKDLLIVDDIGNLSKAEKRRRRKKNALLRSQSVVTYQNKLLLTTEEPTRRASSSEMNRNLFIQELTNGDLTPPAKIEEIPFVLEESEHSSVEPVDYFIENNKSDAIPSLLTKAAKNGSIKSTILKSHSPLFMKTALSTRSKRNSTTKRLNLFKTEKNPRLSPDSSIKSIDNHSFSVSDSQDDQTSLNSDSSKKDKRFGGFKRMFRRVF